MKIYGIRCREVMACAGSWAVVAEAEVETDNANRDTVYVTVQEYDGLEFVVGEQSLYAFLAANGPAPEKAFLEEYRTLKDAKASAYADVFAKLRKVMKMMGVVE